MTSSEYESARAKLLMKLSAPQSLYRDGSVVNRPIRDIMLAIQALDAQWQAESGTGTPRIGRLYISGEGR